MEEKLETLYKLLEMRTDTSKEEIDKIIEMIESAGNDIFEIYQTINQRKDTFFGHMKHAYYITISDTSLLDLKRHSLDEKICDELVEFNDQLIFEGDFAGDVNVIDKLLYDFSQKRNKFKHLTPFFVELYLDFTFSNREYLLPYVVDKANELIKK